MTRLTSSQESGAFGDSPSIARGIAAVFKRLPIYALVWAFRPVPLAVHLPFQLATLKGARPFGLGQALPHIRAPCERAAQPAVGVTQTLLYFTLIRGRVCACREWLGLHAVLWRSGIEAEYLALVQAISGHMSEPDSRV